MGSNGVSVDVTISANSAPVECEVTDFPTGAAGPWVALKLMWGRRFRDVVNIHIDRNREAILSHAEALEAGADALRGVLERMLVEAPCNCLQCEACRAATGMDTETIRKTVEAGMEAMG